MPYDDVQKFSEAAVNKARLLKEHPGKYFLRAVMAGFFIVVAMIFSNVVGNTFQSTDPAWGKLLGGIVFAIAVLLIVFIGAELFTGNNLVMAFGAYDKKVSWAQVGKVSPDSLLPVLNTALPIWPPLLPLHFWSQAAFL